MPLKKVLVDLGRGIWSPSSNNKKNQQKATTLFFSGTSQQSSLPDRHIYYEPPEEFDWSANTALLPQNGDSITGQIVVYRKDPATNPQIPLSQQPNESTVSTVQESSKQRRAYTEREFTTEILARKQQGNSAIQERKDSPKDLPEEADTTLHEDNKMITTSVDRDANERDVMCENTKVQCANELNDFSEDVLTDLKCDKPSCLKPQAGSDSGVSPILERRNKSVLGRLKSFASRTSYSTSDDGHSHSSDYEEQDDDKRVEFRFHRDAKERSSSSWAGKVRHLHRDVKKKISRLRNSRGATPDDEARESLEHPDGHIQTGSSVESIPSGSGSSLQAPTPTSSNRSSTSAGEDDNCPYVGTFLGKARALVDYTPSPYDRDGLAFKKGDIIDIIAKHKTGIWVGMAQGKVGHFKFINVEEILEECKPRYRRHRGPPHWISTASKPETLEQLLKQLGLQEYMNVLVLNGYDELDTFKEIEKEDLDSLGIINPEHGLKLLRAAEMLQGIDIDVDEDEEDRERLKPSPRDSGCYASHENLEQREVSHKMLQEGGTLEGEDVDTSHSESGIHSREGQDLSLAMNNLDLSAESSTKSTTTTMDSKDDIGEGPDDFVGFNIQPSLAEEEVTDTIEVFLQDDSKEPIVESAKTFTESRQPFVPVTTFADSISSSTAIENCFSTTNSTILESPKGISPASNLVKSLSKHTKTKHSRQSKQNHRKSKHQETIPNHISVFSPTFSKREVPEMFMDRSSYVYAWASFPKKDKHCNNARRRAQEYDDVVSDPALDPDDSPGRYVYRRTKQRKGSLQELVRNPRPPSASLMSLVKQKLEKNNICLYEEPYTDKTGFCGIPPALVQRYAEELHQSLSDVADALDQVRITLLQQQARRGVPNDFLADSCTVPVIEANYNCLHSWLISLGLPMYETNFESSGIFQLEQIADPTTMPDLESLAIRDPRHQLFLESAIGALRTRFGVRTTCQSPSICQTVTASFPMS